MQQVNLIDKHGIRFFQFPKLAEFDHLEHGIFTRQNGHSKGPYCSLNIGQGVGDDTGSVQKNREMISRCFNAKQLVFARQRHSAQVFVFDRHHGNVNSKNANSVWPCDALITPLEQTLLVIQVADCQAVLMYEPACGVVANVHAGWRGSIKNIIGRTIEIMKSQLGCSPDRIIAGIGPSLGPCCAEFINYREEIPEKFWKFKNADHHFDFWAISRQQLINAGVADKNISLSHLCTKCRPDLFFSYRGEGVTGRFAAVIGIR
jgi:YfiH family protein